MLLEAPVIPGYVSSGGMFLLAGCELRLEGFVVLVEHLEGGQGRGDLDGDLVCGVQGVAVCGL